MTKKNKKGLIKISLSQIRTLKKTELRLPKEREMRLMFMSQKPTLISWTCTMIFHRIKFYLPITSMWWKIIVHVQEIKVGFWDMNINLISLSFGSLNSVFFKVLIWDKEILISPFLFFFVNTLSNVAMDKIHIFIILYFQIETR